MTATAIGDQQTTEFEELYRRYQRPIQGYLHRMVDDAEVAADLSQETFMRAMRAWATHDPQARVAWLYRIATNTAYSYLRRQRRIRFNPLPEHETEAEATPSLEALLDESEPVREALAQIPPHYRTLLLASYAGRSNQEIAAALGCSSNAVKIRMMRARRSFRAAYQAAA